MRGASVLVGGLKEIVRWGRRSPLPPPHDGKLRTPPCDANFAAEEFAGKGGGTALSPPYFAICTIAIYFVL